MKRSAACQSASLLRAAVEGVAEDDGGSLGKKPNGDWEDGLPPLLWGQPHTLSAALAACKAAAARDAAQETIVLDDAVTSAIVDAASTAVTLGVRALLRVEGAFPDGPPGTVSSWCIC